MSPLASRLAPRGPRKLQRSPRQEQEPAGANRAVLDFRSICAITLEILDESLLARLAHLAIALWLMTVGYFVHFFLYRSNHLTPFGHLLTTTELRMFGLPLVAVFAGFLD
jgi:hypothetical protein